MAPIIRLALLVLVAAASQSVEADINFISNNSGETLNAIASCVGCPAESFTIAPGSFDSYSSEYSDYIGVVEVVLSIGSGQSSTLFIGSDQSIVAYNNDALTGVDIFDAIHGTRVDKDGGVQTTIFP